MNLHFVQIFNKIKIVLIGNQNRVGPSMLIQQSRSSVTTILSHTTGSVSELPSLIKTLCDFSIQF